MLVREVMSDRIVAVGPDTSIKEAAQVLDRHKITSLPVLDERGELLGVVSEADVLLDAFLPDQRAHGKPVRLTGEPVFTTVGEVMSRHVLTVPAGADLAEAADLMLGTVVKSLPVIEENRVIGMLSRTDLIGILAESDAAIATAVDDLIRGAGHDWTSEVTDGVVVLDGPEGESERKVAAVLVGTVPGVVGIRFAGDRVR